MMQEIQWELNHVHTDSRSAFESHQSADTEGLSTQSTPAEKQVVGKNSTSAAAASST